MKEAIVIFLAWIMVGFIGGALAGLVWRGGGYGIANFITVGIVGAMIGSSITDALEWGEDFISFNPASVAGSLVGMVILIAIFRIVWPSRMRA